MKRKLVIFVLLMLAAKFSSGQFVVVVKDITNQTLLIEVSIRDTTTPLNFRTNSSGVAILKNVKASDVLVATYLGYEKRYYRNIYDTSNKRGK